VKTFEQIIETQKRITHIVELHDYLCKAASIAEKIQFNTEEIYDIMEQLKKELAEITKEL
jgi:hypothetical protein